MVGILDYFFSLFLTIIKLFNCLCHCHVVTDRVEIPLMNVLATSNIAAFEAEAKFLIFIVDANFILTHFGKIISTIFFKSC